MKKLLEKPWAKALAFLLTLLPGTAAVYGGSSWYTYVSITCIRTGAWICCGP